MFSVLFGTSQEISDTSIKRRGDKDPRLMFLIHAVLDPSIHSSTFSLPLDRSSSGQKPPLESLWLQPSFHTVRNSLNRISFAPAYPTYHRLRCTLAPGRSRHKNNQLVHWREDFRATRSFQNQREIGKADRIVSWSDLVDIKARILSSRRRIAPT